MSSPNKKVIKASKPHSKNPIFLFCSPFASSSSAFKFLLLVLLLNVERGIKPAPNKNRSKPDAPLSATFSTTLLASRYAFTATLPRIGREINAPVIAVALTIDETDSAFFIVSSSFNCLVKVFLSKSPKVMRNSCTELTGFLGKKSPIDLFYSMKEQLEVK